VDPRIRRVVNLIDQAPHDRHSLESMARTAHLSTSRFRHKFKSEVGATPISYLQAARMRMAAELLKDEEVSIKEVRARIGLNSDSYFTHLFKRVYDQPPSRTKRD